MKRETAHLPARESKRVPGRWNADLYVAGRELPTTCIDLSEGGARIESRLPLRVGQIFVLIIHTEDRGELVCLAQARWVRSDVGELGVQFTEIAADATHRLSHMVTFPTTQTHTWRPWSERMLVAIERFARRILPDPIAPPTEVEMLEERLSTLQRTVH